MSTLKQHSLSSASSSELTLVPSTGHRDQLEHYRNFLDAVNPDFRTEHGRPSWFQATYQKIAAFFRRKRVAEEVHEMSDL
ncbi:hypothetical protein B0H11DRAFT_2257911 [Mycena galericulata]|nr:hypothetical protein B0H11DRAFT_2257911 [Mycena galericulata]